MSVIIYNRSIGVLEQEFKKTDEYAGLNKKQQGFFTEFFKGRNIFLTGPAGVGKSHCLKVLFEFMNKKMIFVAKTALTGVAALNIGGQTIHSWAGMGLADEDTKSIVDKARNNKRARERVRGTGILFVDEVSMSSADLLNKLDAVMKDARHNDDPFGGAQVIFSGDFLQLPPVFRGEGEQLKFAFQSKAWAAAKVSIVHLTKLVRQDESTPFAKLLQKIRFGKTTGLDSILGSRVGARLPNSNNPIKVFCKNVDIDVYNGRQYQLLNSPEKTFVCRDTGNPELGKNFDRTCPAPAILRLKVGARVLLLVNVATEEGLVNGAVGTVAGFGILGPLVKFDNGVSAAIEINKWEMKEQELDLSGKMRYKVIATRSQIPLKLAWATSVHRLQGATLDAANIDLSGAFEHGQHYVALSRVKTLEGLCLTPFDPKRIKAHPECVEFYENHDKKRISE